MILVAQPNDIPDHVKTSVLTIGKFDGVHIGHQDLISHTIRVARKLHKKSLAVTFEPPPVQILRPDLPIRPPITPTNRKIEILKSYGIDEVVVLKTGHWLLDLSARAFFNDIIISGFQATGMVEGPNFSFGKDRSGGPNELRRWCAEKSIEFVETEPVEFDGQWVTSSRICSVLQSGDLHLVTKLLGHPLITQGTVVRGAGRGRSIDVPTANLQDCDTMVPGPGVYAARARVIDPHQPGDTYYPAAVNIGTQPTFDSSVQRLEVHMVGHLDRDLYGEKLEVVWLEKIRETRKFGDIDELRRQIQSDIDLTLSKISAK